MGERAPYSRVYWSVIDDERFADVYKSAVAFGTWVQLLLIADQAWPVSARLPRDISTRGLQKCVDAGLVVLRGGGRFQIHGLDAERERRSAAATSRGPNGNQTGHRRDEPRQDEKAHRPEVVSDFDRRVAATQKMLRETGRLHD